MPSKKISPIIHETTTNSISLHALQAPKSQKKFLLFFEIIFQSCYIITHQISHDVSIIWPDQSRFLLFSSLTWSSATITLTRYPLSCLFHNVEEENVVSRLQTSHTSSNDSFWRGSMNSTTRSSHIQIREMRSSSLEREELFLWSAKCTSHLDNCRSHFFLHGESEMEIFRDENEILIDFELLQVDYSRLMEWDELSEEFLI